MTKNEDNEIRKKDDGRRMGAVVQWHHLGNGVVFDGEVAVAGGGFTGHVNYFGRCTLTDHDRSLPGVQGDGTWAGTFHTFASEALHDIGDHPDGQAFLMRELHGTVIGPIDPASVS